MPAGESQPGGSRSASFILLCKRPRPPAAKRLATELPSPLPPPPPPPGKLLPDPHQQLSLRTLPSSVAFARDSTALRVSFMAPAAGAPGLPGRVTKAAAAAATAFPRAGLGVGAGASASIPLARQGRGGASERPRLLSLRPLTAPGDSGPTSAWAELDVHESGEGVDFFRALRLCERCGPRNGLRVEREVAFPPRTAG